MNSCICTRHMSHIFHIVIDGRAIRLWKMSMYEQLHWQLSYVHIFHIAIDRRVIRDVRLRTYEQLHLHLSHVFIFHIATDRRVIRDVENVQLWTSALAVVICPGFPHRD